MDQGSDAARQTLQDALPKCGPDFLCVEEMQKARGRIAGKAHVTPILTCTTFNERSELNLYFKAENLQKTGSFKIRGALNALGLLTESEKKRGVVTHSSGNHAQALSLAAKLHGVQATVIMPSDAPAVKRSAVEGYGANVVTAQPNLKSREETCASVLKETGGVMIPPYNHPFVICGQATIGLEMIEQVEAMSGGAEMDAVVVPVGGGGMMSGVASAMRALRPHTRVFGAEPAAADDARRSLEAGERILHKTRPSSIADGLLTSLGDVTWPIIKEKVERIFTVEERVIKDTIALVMERMKIVIEPSAAVGIAVALSSEFRGVVGKGARVGVVICGGNIDLKRLAELLLDN
mmetsp:Transcript_31155/g.81748  ORF Transcript_31155/g.81748 Transcript_31155/m.81748 type:complete len:350 (-) Transcript_31155:493-1542(-)